MGSIGANRNTVSSMPWRQVYQQYRTEIENASELTINPDTGRAYFSKSEAATTPVIEDFVSVKGSDEQIRKYYDDLYPHKMVSISRSKYW